MQVSIDINFQCQIFNLDLYMPFLSNLCILKLINKNIRNPESSLLGNPTLLGYVHEF